MTSSALLHYRAERLLRKDFEGLRPRVTAIVRSRLGARGAGLDEADLDACYAQAWYGLYVCMLEGEQIDDVSAWLVVVTFRRAIDELRARARQAAASEAQAGLALSGGGMPAWSAPDLAARLDDRATLRQVAEALSARLSPRERRAASLCYLQGLSRAQAARQLGVSQARMRKLMDGSPGRPGVAAKVNAALQAVGGGEWCEQQGSLMRAYAFGVLDPQGARHRLARAHLRECSACRALVRLLRGLAVVLPPPTLPAAAGSGDGRVRRTARARIGDAGARGGRAARAMRGRLGVRALLPKLALAGIVALAIGAERAPLAGRATGRAVRPAAVTHASGHGIATHVSRYARVRRRAQRLTAHVVHRTAPPVAGRQAPRTAGRPVAHVISRPAPAATAHGAATAGTSVSSSSRRSGPEGEFTPERAAR